MFYTNLIKIPTRFFVDINKLILKFIYRDRGPRVVTTILKSRIEWEELFYPILRLSIWP